MKNLTYGSVCSGIEAASVAWEPLGWKPEWFAEIEKFPSAVLGQRWPDVPNLGDMTQLSALVQSGRVAAPDVLVGGTPCQSFSVAGLRKSLEDERGQLTLAFVLLANEIDSKRKESGRNESIIVWENVPGVLNTKDNAFGNFLAALAGEDEELQPPGKRWTNAGVVSGPQRTVAWRVLDAQYFGVAQRRRRVFVVASARDDTDPAEILFEREGLRRDIAPSREAGKEVTELAGTLAANAGGLTRPAGNGNELDFCVANGQPYDVTAFGQYGPGEAASTCKARDYKDATDKHAVAHCFKVRGGCEGGGKGYMGQDEQAYTLATSHDQDLWTGRVVRRLTPTECERLQGFPPVVKRYEVDIWFTGHRKNCVPAGEKNPKSQKPALSVENEQKKESVKYADEDLLINVPQKRKPVQVSVQLNYVTKTLVLRSAEKFLFSASVAESTKQSPHQDLVESFAQMIAGIGLILEKITPDGTEGLRQKEICFTQVKSGNLFSESFGQGKKEFARDVEMFTKEVNKLLKGITLKGGLNTQSTDLNYQTLLYYVAQAINLFTQKKMVKENSYLNISLSVVSGYTQIPWRGKPADECPDGPRYKAIGNSMAVPVMKWLGQRIASNLDVKDE